MQLNKFRWPVKKRFRIALGLLIIFATGFVLPQRVVIPVDGATPNDWNENAFWYEPWGSSGVHKGVDIFGKFGQRVISTTDGIVLYSGQVEKGGNIVIVLGPKWRIHYYAHLESITTSALSLVSSRFQIGTLGDSGNAKGKPPHLHYSIVSLVPRLWAIDGNTQGYKKAFYIDPSKVLIH